MWGYEEIIGFIRRQVGVRTDAANASGSAHAKLTKLSEDMASNQAAMMAELYRHPWKSGKGLTLTIGSNTSSISNSDGQYHDSLRITGPRIIIGGHIIISNVNDDDVSHRIMSDSQSIFNLGNSSLYNDKNGGWSDQFDRGVYDPRVLAYNGSAPTMYHPVTINLPPLLYFDGSFSIEYRVSSGQSGIPYQYWAIWHISADES